MESLALFRVFKTSFTNFWRNIWLSTAATLVMVITLMILTLTLMLINVSNFAVQNIQQKVDVSVYFNTQTSEQQILNIKSRLQQMPEVSQITYVSADQALDNFKKQNANKPLILQSLEEVGENPFPPTLQVQAKQLDQYPAIVSALGAPEYQTYINKINFEDNRSVIDRLSRLLKTSKKVGVGLAVVFAAIAILVIFNTIRLTIYNRREEVEIMRLVGATNWYIRWPFIIESMLYGLFASVISIILVLPIYGYILPKINSYLDSTGFAGINLLKLFGMQLAVGLVLGIISSLIAIRRYLKV